MKIQDAKQARPHCELIAELLDSRRPKTEREHAAAREIERLRDLCDDLYSDLLACLVGRLCPKRKERRMLNLKDPAKRAEWVYGQPMAPCPKCGSYNMKPQIPIAMETTGDETAPQLVGKWAQATKAGATPVQGPAYYACWDCFHKGPAVDCTGRTSEDCRADRALNAEMKRLWNAQTPNAAFSGSGTTDNQNSDGLSPESAETHS